MGKRTTGHDDSVAGDVCSGGSDPANGAPVGNFLEHDRKLAATAVVKMCVPVYTLQCLIGETNEKKLADLLDSESHTMELYAFAAQYLIPDDDHDALYEKVAAFRNKCVQAAALLREIECDVDKLGQSTIRMSKEADA